MNCDCGTPESRAQWNDGSLDVGPGDGTLILTDKYVLGLQGQAQREIAENQ